MTGNTSRHIVAFVGLAGSGKSSAVEYLAAKGIPKVQAQTSEEIIDEVSHVIDAGQRTVLVDGISSIDNLRALKHAFSGSVSVVAIVSSRHHRLQRGPDMDAEQLDARDWLAVESGTLGAVIALADHFVANNDDLASFHRSIDALNIV